MAYENHTGPIGSYRLDRAAAVISHTIYQSNGGKGKISDFMPVWDFREEVTEVGEH